MEKTIQQQYDLIKEGKGNKDDFLKSARRVFPELITPGNDYNTAVHILKSKSILSEGTSTVTDDKNWFKIFETNLKEDVDVKVGDKLKHKLTKAEFKITNILGNNITGKYTKLGDMEGKVKIGDINKTNKNLIGKTYELLSEAVGVKDTKEYGNQNTFEKIDKDVKAALDHQFDNKDPKNIDNVYGQSFLIGYLAEMDDPKNSKKTVDELKAIVAKNMAKDINYYAKNGMFGVKGIGLETSKESKPLKGKHKSSGYGDLKESIKENKPGTQNTYRQEINWIKYEVDYVPDNIEVYKKWPEPYKSEALKALEYRKRNFSDMSKDKLDSLKENILSSNKKKKARSALSTHLQAAKSEKDKEGENEVKKAREQIMNAKSENELISILDDFGYDKGEIDNILKENKLRSVIRNLINEELNEVKRIAVSTEIKEIEKTNEALALEAKIKSIDEAIEKRQAKLNLAESEKLAEMIDKNMVKTLQKEIKELEKYKAKASKMYEKMIGSTKKEVIDETLNEGNDFGGAGLLVYGRTKRDNDLIDQVLEEEGYYGIFNTHENYWFFPEGEETIDQLENNLENIFIKKGINARFKGQFNETLNESKLRSVIRNLINEELENQEKYIVTRSGGSIGEKEFKKEFNSKEEAMEYARSRNKQLSPGEKSYYKIRYNVRKAKPNELNENFGRTTYTSLDDAKFEAQRISDEEGVVQHVEETSEGSGEYRVSDWYDSDLTVASYENGMEL